MSEVANFGVESLGKYGKQLKTQLFGGSGEGWGWGRNFRSSKIAILT